MKHKLLSTAAILAALAMGQSVPGVAQSPGSPGVAQSPGSKSGSPGERSQVAPSQGHQPQARDGAPQGRQTQGQQPRGQHNNAAQSREQGQQGNRAVQSREQQHQGQQSSPRGSASQRGNQDQTTGQGEQRQGQGNQGQINQQNPDRRGQSQAQQPSAQPDRSGSQTQSQQQPQPGRTGEPQDQAQQAGRDGSNVNLTAEQRDRIRTTVMARNNVPRVDNVNFSIRVGTVVPRRVRVVEVPSALIAIHPQWRGHRYFVIRDEIIIVDRDYRIISVVPVGSGNEARHDGRDGASLALSNDGANIREVQIVLRQKGFDIEVDGVMGPRTRQAIIAFQRQQGLQATGEIDQRTSLALGVSRSSPGSDQTTGQGSPQSPAVQPSQNPLRGNSQGSQPGMSPEPRGSTNQPAAK